MYTTAISTRERHEIHARQASGASTPGPLPPQRPRRWTRSGHVLSAALCLAAAGAARAQTCEWSSLADGFYDGAVYAMVEWNGKLYVGGSFTKIGTTGSLTVNHIAKWDPVTQAWSALGTGVNGDVNALCVWNNALYAGGYFTSASGTSARGVAKWNGTTWSALGSGTGGSIYEVLALAVWNNALYVGGYFTTAGGSTAKGIARWSGSSWSEVGGGVTGTTYPNVAALLVWNNELYVGGAFTHAGTVPSYSVAKWNGSTWTGLGAGGPGGYQVFTLAVWNNDLYAGGDFTFWEGGQRCDNIARRCGAGWCALGSGATGGAVSDIIVFDEDGAGSRPSALYVGGAFSQTGGLSLGQLARWDGAAWSAICPSGISSTVNDLYLFDDGGGSAMYAGGAFYYACDTYARRIARRAPGLSPRIATSPTPLAINTGTPATFAVAVDGSEPIDYQWRKNGAPLSDDDRISGSRTNSLTIDPALVADGGAYDVVVTNGCGSATSAVATLAVYVHEDFDYDGDVDLADFATFQSCFNGPNHPIAPGCDAADLDGDGDVDLSDFGILLGCFNGPNHPPACG